MEEGLLKYFNKTVRVLAADGETYTGYISDYIDSDSNDNGMESILMDNPFVEFYPNQILKIEILDN